ncbi:vacuolar protein sorting-associated protein 4b [Anaeramoeba flamelloides]|uniref:Vacuolar protein sorting-associated protein 4b n=1 Tax=Anaeramoeba flamelloides TaxID=1746091 RepID=A0AAV7YRK7_9EUKA|nr:vacuolar protein sorting-associated protein 4b [Anaeramoeba flamelloides]
MSNLEQAEKQLSKYKNVLLDLMDQYKTSNQTRKITLKKEIETILRQAEQLKQAIQKKKEEQQFTEKEKEKEKEKEQEEDKQNRNMNEADHSIEEKELLVFEDYDVTWNDIVGLKKVKDILRERVILPIKFPNLFCGLRKTISTLLLFGPPGCGKKYSIKALAHETGLKIFKYQINKFKWKESMDPTIILKQFFQQTQNHKNIIRVFENLDEIFNQEIKYDNRRIKTELLMQLDNLYKIPKTIPLLLISNKPWLIDRTFLKRIQIRIYYPLPDSQTRIDLLRNNLSKERNNLNNDDFQKISNLIEGYSHYEIVQLTKVIINKIDNIIQTSKYFKKISKEENNNLNSEKNDYLTPCGKNTSGAIKINLADIDPKFVIRPNITVDLFCSELQTYTSLINIQDVEKNKQFQQEYGGLYN